MTITLPDRFRNVIRRIAGLNVGRYFIVLNVESDKLSYTVKRVGPIEAGSVPSLDSLTSGRYVAVLTVSSSGMVDHTIQRIGKVEK